MTVSTARLRNCRRVTPSSSSSTGSHLTTSPLGRTAGTSPAISRVSSERSRPVASSSVDADTGSPSTTGCDWSRDFVSRDSVPVVARRRLAVRKIVAAATSKMTMIAMAMPNACSYSSKKMPSFQGNTKLKPWPRKNEPMMTRTAHNIRKIVIIVMANFRSLGLFDGFLSK